MLDLPEGGLLAAIVRFDLAVGSVLEATSGRAGLPFADYLVLAVVRRSPGGRSAPTAIAAELGRTKGGVTLALDRLDAKGLLRRSPDPDDGRRVVVELTPKGRRVASKVNDALHAWEASIDPPARAVRVLEDLTAAIRHGR